MDRPTRLLTTALTSSLTGLLTALVTLLSLMAAPAHAEDPAPPWPGAGTLDPVIAELPPRPAPYVKYDGRICRRGTPRCIDRAIEQMQQRLRPLARSCSHRAIFSLAYLRVTQDVRQAVGSGWFDDTRWLSRVDAVFAHLYFRTLDRWEAGDRDVPAAWAVALQAEDDRAMTGLGNFMLAMNAHINRDFSYVLARVGLTRRDGISHKRDHNAYNERLDRLYAPVFKEEARRFDPSFDDIDAGPGEETAAGVIMRGWREQVWRNAEHLALAETPQQRRAVRVAIEQYALDQALMIRQMFASPDSSERDAYCRSRR